MAGGRLSHDQRQAALVLCSELGQISDTPKTTPRAASHTSWNPTRTRAHSGVLLVEHAVTATKKAASYDASLTTLCLGCGANCSAYCTNTSGSLCCVPIACRCAQEGPENCPSNRPGQRALLGAQNLSCVVLAGSQIVGVLGLLIRAHIDNRLPVWTIPRSRTTDQHSHRQNHDQVPFHDSPPLGLIRRSLPERELAVIIKFAEEKLWKEPDAPKSSCHESALAL